MKQIQPGTQCAITAENVRNGPSVPTVHLVYVTHLLAVDDPPFSMSDNGCYRTLSDSETFTPARSTAPRARHQCYRAHILRRSRLACTTQEVRDARNEHSGMECFVEDRKSTRLNSSHVSISYAV